MGRQKSLERFRVFLSANIYNSGPHLRNSLVNFRSDAFLIKGDISSKSEKSSC